MNNNTKNTDLSSVTNTSKGTSEQGALKTIHRNYNKLNGYEAMLHIINRYRFVLYPFILLSIAGSSYSFYNDFVKAFPMLSDGVNVVIAFFFSVMLEIVRDGSIIALFNGKMRIPSRLLVVVIFISVTSYMYSSHLKAIKVIEKSAVEYTLTHQDENQLKANNPKYDVAVQELEDLKQDLADKKAELTPQLIANTTSIYKSKRKDAIAQKSKIDNEIKEIKANIKTKQNEIIGYKNDNITSIEDSQKLITNILLATLLLIESLAMLGAVIKFINKDNADKEVAKHKEIVEEYESISEQMRKTNDELGLMLSRDIEAVGDTNVAYVKALAENRQMFQAQINEVLKLFSQTQPLNFSMPQPVPQVAQYQEPTEAPQRKIGFQLQSEEELIKALWNEGKIKEGKKLTPKSKVINPNNRKQDEHIRALYTTLQEAGAIEFKPSRGYFAKTDLQTAINLIGGN